MGMRDKGRAVIGYGGSLKGRKQPNFNPILLTAWLDNHALTLKSNSAKYYFYEKSRFLHTFLKFCCESRKF